VDLVVDHVDRPVGAHLQRLLQRVSGLLGADRQDGDLPLTRLRHEESLLDRILVEL
jgi:hypothetical protein